MSRLLGRIQEFLMRGAQTHFTKKSSGAWVPTHTVGHPVFAKIRGEGPVSGKKQTNKQTKTKTKEKRGTGQPPKSVPGLHACMSQSCQHLYPPIRKILFSNQEDFKIKYNSMDKKFPESERLSNLCTQIGLFSLKNRKSSAESGRVGSSDVFISLFKKNLMGKNLPLQF